MSDIIVIQRRKVGGNLLLDLYPATVAYSLRKLKTGVFQVARVRRASDNTEQDFTDVEITDGTLATFCGASDGFVTIWYDQTGNGHHLVQVTNSEQPKVYDDILGVLVENGEPALDFDGIDDFMTTSAIAPFNTDIFSAFFVAKSASATNQVVFNNDYTSGAGANSDKLWGYYYDTTDEVFYSRDNAGVLVDATLTRTNVQQLVSGFWKADDTVSQYRNISTFIQNTGADAIPTGHLSLIVGAEDSIGTLPLLGSLQELIIYTADESTNKTAIENNIYNFYNIISNARLLENGVNRLLENGNIRELES